MADITITATNVKRGPGAVIVHGILAATVTAGQVLYRLADGTFGLADANGASTLIKTPYGIALNGGAAGQPVAILTAGRIYIGGTAVQGTVYVLSATPGGIAPAADLASGHTVSPLGVGYDADELSIAINRSGIAVP